MNICHVVPGLHPQAGGPSRTVVQLADALASDPAVHISLVSQKRHGDPEVASRNASVAKYVGQVNSQLAGGLGLPGRQKLIELFDNAPPALVHLHGIWHPQGHWASLLAHRHNIPAVVNPRGMLEPWALTWRGWTKSLALWTYQQRDLERASVLFATAEQEAENLRRFGLQ